MHESIELLVLCVSIWASSYAIAKAVIWISHP